MSQEKSILTTHRQAIEHSFVYPRDEVEAILKLNKNTIGTWIKLGLKVVDVPDSKQMFFGEDLIEFLNKYRRG